MDSQEAIRAIEAVRPLLPFAAAWLPAFVWLTGAALAGALSTAAGLRFVIGPLRRAEDAHWTERARHAFPVGQTAVIATLISAMTLGLLAAASVGPLSAIRSTPLAILAGTTAYLASFAVRRPFMREIANHGSGFVAELGGGFVGLLLLLPHSLVVVVMVATIHAPLDVSSFGAIALAAAVFAALCHSSGIPILRLIGAARPAGPELEALVRGVATRSGQDPRAIWLLRWPAANAIAFPMSQQLGFTERLVALLDDDELEAVAAHELGHLSEPAMVRWARSAGLFALFPIGLFQPIFHHWGLVGVVALLGGVVLVLVAVVSMARRMEHRADEAGHAHEGDEGSYARALEKIYETNLTPAVMPGKRQVHPHLYDRLQAAGAEPDYPRPAPPSQWRAFGGMLASLVVLTVIANAVMFLPAMTGLFASSDEAGLHWRVALSGGGSGAYALGVQRGAAQDIDQAVIWLSFEAARRPTDHHSPAYAATLLAWNGDCVEAGRALDLAETRAADSPETRPDCAFLVQARQSLDSCGVIHGGV